MAQRRCAIRSTGRAIQCRRTTDQPAFTIATRKGPVTLRPRYRFVISAVVAGAERYRLDAGAFLSPLDLALVWGSFPGRALLEPGALHTDRALLPLGHLVARARPRLHPGALFQHAHDPSGRQRAPRPLAAGRQLGPPCAASSSISRGRTASPGRPRHPGLDTDAGACEVVWVEEAQVGDWICPGGDTDAHPGSGSRPSRKDSPVSKISPTFWRRSFFMRSWSWSRVMVRRSTRLRPSLELSKQQAMTRITPGKRYSTS